MVDFGKKHIDEIYLPRNRFLYKLFWCQPCQHSHRIHGKRGCLAVRCPCKISEDEVVSRGARFGGRGER